MQCNILTTEYKLIKITYYSQVAPKNVIADINHHQKVLLPHMAVLPKASASSWKSVLIDDWLYFLLMVWKQ